MDSTIQVHMAKGKPQSSPLAWHARDVCARHVCVWRPVSAYARGTWSEVALARPWSDWDDSWTGMAAVRVRQLGV